MEDNGAHWAKAVALTHFVALLVAVSPLAGQEVELARPEEHGFSSERLERVTGFVRGEIDRSRIAGAVTLVSRGGNVVYYDAEGHADLEKDSAMAEDSIFRIMSMTKPIVSVAVSDALRRGPLPAR